MNRTLDTLIWESAEKTPHACALVDAATHDTYQDLARATTAIAAGLVGLSLCDGARIAIFLPKQREAVISMFAASAAGCTFVPINPALKAAQVLHILADCGVEALVTSAGRLTALAPHLAGLPALRHIVLTDVDRWEQPLDQAVVGWAALHGTGAGSRAMAASSLAAILYTSGSTGKPKGVMLSHDNLVIGAHSVAGYLNNTPDDRILAVMPLSFDYGLSQITTAFFSGARAVLHNYLLPKDLIAAVAQHKITGLGCVPPLWLNLTAQTWPDDARTCLRYITNTGGRVPRPLFDRFYALFPNADIYLMYGLTEAFRSTYVPPDVVREKPDSIGKAIPYAEVRVINPDGHECADMEVGELVHAGPLVAQGYWGDPERTAQRFRPAPPAITSVPPKTPVVWSGDNVRRDKDGFLYFVGRDDDMIKTSGYRVSPTEIEEVAYASMLVGEAVAWGQADDALGQSIHLIATPPANGPADSNAILAYFKTHVPSYMVPEAVHWCQALPRNSNGKIDRRAASQQVMRGGNV